MVLLDGFNRSTHPNLVPVLQTEAERQVWHALQPQGLDPPPKGVAERLAGAGTRLARACDRLSFYSEVTKKAVGHPGTELEMNGARTHQMSN